MGYRSEVRCLIYGEKDDLDAFITEHSLISNSTALLQFKDSLTRYTIARIILRPADGHSLPKTAVIHVLDLYGDSWKWYESYPDVQAWHALMTELDDREDLGYEFIRIGEEPDDIERHCNVQSLDLLYLSSPTINQDFEKIAPTPFSL